MKKSPITEYSDHCYLTIMENDRTYTLRLSCLNTSIWFIVVDIPLMLKLVTSLNLIPLKKPTNTKLINPTWTRENLEEKLHEKLFESWNINAIQSKFTISKLIQAPHCLIYQFLYNLILVLTSKAPG